jgi:glycosidase
MAKAPTAPDVVIPNEKLVIYQVLLDRFAAGNDQQMRYDHQHLREGGKFWCGGSLKGVLDKLDYIQALGCNALWLSPWQQNTNDAYHGYHIMDLFKVDPRFGTEADIINIAQQCRVRGMMLIGDFVPNHISSQHQYFVEAQKDSASQYRDWFFFRQKPPGYECFLTFGEIAKLNLDNPACQKHVIDAAKYWVDRGVDVLRLDHCLGPTNSFWRAFVAALKAHKPTVQLYGEAFFEEYFSEEQVSTLRVPNPYRILWGAKLLRMLGFRHAAFDVAMRPYVGILDGCLDFGYQAIVQDYATSPLPRPIRALLAHFRLAIHRLFFPASFALLRFADNHDMNRLMFKCGGDEKKYLEGMRFLFGQSGRHPVVLYQGDEIGMNQPMSFEEFGGYGDLMCRSCMPWKDDTRLQPVRGKYLTVNMPIVSEVQRLIAIKTGIRQDAS